MVALSCWVGFVTDRSVRGFISSLSSEQLLALSSNESTSLGLDKRTNMLKNIEFEFVKIQASTWKGKQTAIFRLRNNNQQPITELCVNILYFDEDNNLLETRVSTRSSNYGFAPGKDHYISFDYEYVGSFFESKYDFGLASHAKAEGLCVGAVI